MDGLYFLVNSHGTISGGINIRGRLRENFPATSSKIMGPDRIGAGLGTFLCMGMVSAYSRRPIFRIELIRVFANIANAYEGDNR